MSGQLEDTICAIATPVGDGGIGIVRISGEKAIEVASGLVRLRSGRSLVSVKSHTLYQADILDTAAARDAGRAVDEALVVVMRSPHSYTAEDVVEIHCHGGPLVLQTVCEAVMRRGARLAEPGEFTKRAFLNGRLDLTQAEAVLDTICAKTVGSLRIAQAQLRGTLSKEIDRMRDTLIRLLAHVEAAIDFTEEDITFIQPQELTAGLQQTLAEIARLVDSAQQGRILREGVTAAIIGRPNVGKSSLLNALLKSDRAIVTPVPGTTHDVLEEVLNIRGVPIRLLDTAGVRHTDDPVEQEGGRRIRTMILRPDFEPGEAAVVTRLRHQAALVRAHEALTGAAGSVEARLSGEFVAVDLRAAIDALGEITGAVSTDDILDRIFREFCIGK